MVVGGDGQNGFEGPVRYDFLQGGGGGGTFVFIVRGDLVAILDPSTWAGMATGFGALGVFGVAKSPQPGVLGARLKPVEFRRSLARPTGIEPVFSP
ncbi:MAG TPA: hypothetical protein VFE60_27400 [Roseiarcus sp.]|jgi:hypothetical protein|nr:hypothetical protein [Roseiarcus sp.]